MATQAPGGLDFEALRRAIEERDAETLLGFYADDAELRTVNRNTTPSSPRVLRGKEEISEYLRDVCSREMTHRVENEVVGGIVSRSTRRASTRMGRVSWAPRRSSCATAGSCAR
jgi:hypothetical protein